jgi:hypothetical protein
MSYFIIVMLNVMFSDCYAECHNAESRYAEFRYVECHYAECCYAEYNFTECRYGECRGATPSTHIKYRQHNHTYKDFT